MFVDNRSLFYVAIALSFCFFAYDSHADDISVDQILIRLTEEDLVARRNAEMALNAAKEAAIVAANARTAADLHEVKVAEQAAVDALSRAATAAASAREAKAKLDQHLNPRGQ